MPLYNDRGFYYSPTHLTTPSYFSSPFLGTSDRSSGLGLLPVPRLLPPRISSGYTSSLLTSIPESGYGSSRLGLPPLDRSASPRPALPRYLPPKPVHINTSDIDVSAARYTHERRERRPEVTTAAGCDPSRQATIKRDRTVVRLHTQKLKENPTLDVRRRMTPGEKLMQKFLILDKAEEEAKAARRKRLEEMEERERVEAEVTRLQAMAAKRAASDADSPLSSNDGTFAPDPEVVPPTQHFPTIQGLTENAALDILLSATDDDEEKVQGGDISRTNSTGTVKKRKIKEKEGTVKAAKKKTKKKDADSSPAEDSPATGDEMIERSMLQRRNTVRFRRNSSDVDAFPEIEVVPGSRRSSFDQTAGSRRSSMDSTGDEIPLASEKKSTVKRKKGPKHKIVADVSVDNSPTREPRSPKFVVDEVKVEQSPASPMGGLKKFRYEVIVEDVEEESAAARRGRSGKENKTEVVARKKKAKATPAKPLANRQEKSAPKADKVAEVKTEVKETTPKSFQKSPLESAPETKSHVADSKTDEITGKLIQQKSKEVAQEVVTPKPFIQEKNKEIKLDNLKESITTKIENEVEETKKDKEKQKPVVAKDRKLSKDLDLPKLGAKDIQKGVVAVDKPKPATQTSVVSKVEESKIGKHVVEKTKVKHQADPTPIPVTPTSETGIQKSESGINFWDFLNGVEEEKEIKKPFLTMKQPEVTPEVSKNEKTKAKPNLHLNIQNKCAPSEKALDASDTESKAIKIETKVTDLKEPKKLGLPTKISDEKVSKLKTPEAKTQETTDNSGKVGKDVKKVKELVSPILDRQSEVTKAKETALLSNANQNETKCTVVTTFDKLKVGIDDAKRKEGVKESPEASTDSVTKPLETPETKPVPKWKAFGKQPPSPASPKEAVQSPKPPAIPQNKNAEMKFKSPISGTTSEATKTNSISTVVPSPTSDTIDGSTTTIIATSTTAITASTTTTSTATTKDVGAETPKIVDANQKDNALLSPKQKDSPSVEESAKKKDLKNKLSKEGTPESDSKPVPKWKVKTPADKEAGLKKPPLGKIKQSSSDSSIVTPTAGEGKKDASSLTVKTSSSEPVTPTSDKEKSIVEGVKLSATKPPNDVDKPPKKPVVKNKIATKQPETPPTPGTPSKLTPQLEAKDNKTSLPSVAITDSVTSKDIKEAELKKEISIEKSKDDVPVSKPKLTEQKNKEEEKDTRLPLGKKLKVPEQKPNKKEETITQDLVAKKEEVAAKKSKDEEKPEQKTKDLIDVKNEDKPPVKKVGKLFAQKSKDEGKTEPLTPLKKAVKPIAPKSKEESEPSSPVKKTDKLATPKSDDSGEEKKEPTTPLKKGLKPVVQKSKDEEKSEPQSPVKKGFKPITQKSKEDSESPSAAQNSAKLVSPKTKEDPSEPTSPVKKTAKLPAEKSKDEEQTKPSPVKKNAQLVPQKSKEDEKKEVPLKKGLKPVGLKVEKTTTDAKEKSKLVEKTKEEKKTPAELPAPATATSPALESGSEADSEDSSSEDGEDDSTPRASSSSCSSSDSGFDSRPSSVPGSPPSNKKVPSTASEASSREPGSPSPALSCSPSLDPYSEDAGLPRNAQSSGRTTPPAHSLPRFRKYTVDDFQFLKLLGKGSFGKVLLAELRGTDRHYAVKCLKKDVVLEDDDVECTLIERKVLALGSRHPYLCHLFCTFQTESHLLFVMEYLNGGDLMFHIQQSGRFAEHRARFYAAEIISGLKFLHKKGIVYRDLKLDNILLDYEGHVRIADFGMCKLQIFLDRTADTFCGTPDYMAPEIIKGLKYNQCVDWWSFGVLVFEMLVGVSPFTGCDEDELFWSICNDQPQYPRFLSREAHSLLSSLLEKDATKRLGTPSSPKGDVPDHVFFRSVDWDALERRELEPPFRPRVKHPLDVQYFDAAFTAERAELTPVDKSILQSMDQAQFQGFSYTNPNATD